jgi:hypothetical protein
MSRLRSALAFLGLAFACRALPSAIPLSDTGEGRVIEDGALSRNRVPHGDRKSSSDDSGDDVSSGDDSVTIVANSADAGDAGTSEAGALASDAGDAGAGWAGEYFGSDRQVKRLSGKAEEVEDDDKAHTRVEEPSPGVALVSLVSSADGTVICGMKMRITGNRAELDAGETCAPLLLIPPFTIKGTATLDGAELDLSLSGHGEFPGDDGTLEMDVEYHFEGKRR